MSAHVSVIDIIIYYMFHILQKGRIRKEMKRKTRGKRSTIDTIFRHFEYDRTFSRTHSSCSCTPRIIIIFLNFPVFFFLRNTSWAVNIRHLDFNGWFLLLLLLFVFLLLSSYFFKVLIDFLHVIRGSIHRVKSGFRVIDDWIILAIYIPVIFVQVAEENRFKKKNSRHRINKSLWNEGNAKRKKQTNEDILVSMIGSSRFWFLFSKGKGRWRGRKIIDGNELKSKEYNTLFVN